MNVLIACEESQAVCIEARRMGHNAFSCDIQECSGGHPEWHIMGDALPLLNGRCSFETTDGARHEIAGRWDTIIAHPPCTFLTNTGNRWFDVDRYGDKAMDRIRERIIAAEFFMEFAVADCERIAIENPVGVMSTLYRKPDQITHPYMFGSPETKATCWWLKNLPPLIPTQVVVPEIVLYKNGTGSDSPWHMRTAGLPPAERRKERSKTPPGLAKAIAEQWLGDITKGENT